MRHEWTERPWPMEEIAAKFWHQVDFSKTASRENAEKLLNLVENLEEVDNVNTIVKLLVQ